MISSEEASPNPEYLIKSIAEQGYGLETALADLMDNSISAGAKSIELLIDSDSEPFTLFLADDGNGMSEESLSRNMRFPSSSSESTRKSVDLGRFGLGMKTASFSQTRKFTVISREKGQSEYKARTWDVDFLKKNGWRIVIPPKDEINLIIQKYKEQSEGKLSAFENYQPNTIIVWYGLYKFQEYLSKDIRRDALHKQVTQITSDYLSLVFHRFLSDSKHPLKIRINNIQIDPFDPFPQLSDVRKIEPKIGTFKGESVRIEGYILPSRSIEEAKSPHSIWTTKYRGLMDMEGIYVYRANRIILFGGWNGLIRKAPRLQLARLKIDVGNGVDHLLHLNVAKSQITIPHELISVFDSVIDDLKDQAEKEYYNRGIRSFSGIKDKPDNHHLFDRISSNKGIILEINDKFPLIQILSETLSKEQKSHLNLLLKMITHRINEIRRVHEQKETIQVHEKDASDIQELKTSVQALLNAGVSKSQIRESILPNLGYNPHTLATSLGDLLKDEKS